MLKEVHIGCPPSFPQHFLFNITIHEASWHVPILSNDLRNGTEDLPDPGSPNALPTAFSHLLTFEELWLDGLPTPIPLSARVH